MSQETPSAGGRSTSYLEKAQTPKANLARSQNCLAQRPGKLSCLAIAGASILFGGAAAAGVVMVVSAATTESPPPPSPPEFFLPRAPPSPPYPPPAPGPPPSPPDIPCTGADLIVEERTLRTSVYTQWLNNADPCAVDESCFTGMGARRVLRFSTLIANIGCEDYVVGAPSISAGWTWHDCHQHYHYINYANYQLVPLCADVAAAIAGHKNGWCVYDAGSYFGDGLYGPEGSPGCGRGYLGCSSTQFSQGISAGCYDVYPADLNCQWIDITDVPAGTYTLRIETNWDPATRLASTPESNYSNNAASIVVDLSRQRVRALGDSEALQAMRAQGCAR